MQFWSTLRALGPSARLVLVGSFGAGNLGDELILAGFCQELKRQLPKAQVTVLSGQPSATRRWHGVPVLPMLPTGWRSLWAGGWSKSLSAVKNADAVIYPGGGLWTDTESLAAVWIWGLHLLVARYYWRPVYLLGQSIGPWRTSWGRWFTHFCLSKAELIGTRDRASLEALEQIQIPVRHIELGTDSALYLKPESKTKPVKSAKKQLKILVTLRDYPGVPQHFWEILASELDRLVASENIELSFIEFGSGDRAVWQAVKDLSTNKNLGQCLPTPTSTTQILSAVKKYDLVLGMRLHSLVAARLVGRPALALSYSAKVTEFAKTNKQPLVEVKNCTATQLRQLFKKIKPG